jgi:hypothetical protein
MHPPPSELARRAAAALALTLLVASAARAQSSDSAATPSRCLDSAAVTVPAMLDRDHPVYVEQETVVAGDDGRVLVAGNPVFVWQRSAAGYDLLSHDSLFGIVIDTAATHVSGIPSPLPGRSLTGVRAAALRDGWWLVTFAEVVPVDMPKHPAVLAMWAGETDGARWRGVVKLPAVPDSLDSMNMARLDLRDGRVRLAVLGRRGDRRHVVVYSRDEGRWRAVSHDAGLVNYVAITSTATRDLLAVVRPDTTEVTVDRNSLFLYAKGHADTIWSLQRRVARGARTPVHDPLFVADDERPMLFWRTRAEDGSTDGWMAPVELRSAQPPTHFASGVWTLDASVRGRGAVLAVGDASSNRTLQLFELHLPDRLIRVSTRKTSSRGLLGVALTQSRAIAVLSQPGNLPREPAVISLLSTHAWRCP